MSVDAVRTLHPSLGLVSEASIYVPNEVGLWRTVGRLANSAPGARLASAVGAFDVTKRASLTRGAGEAVERFALVPVPEDSEHLLAGNGSLGTKIDFVGAGLGHASALACDLPWYRATDLLTGEPTLVPAPVVDYTPGSGPLNSWDDHFDPSPNGAASGPSEAFAQGAGVAEVMERDAFLSAWRHRISLERFDPESMPVAVRQAPEARGLSLLLVAARAVGVESTLAFIPSGNSPLVTAVCIITEDNGSAEFGAVGLKTASDPVNALRGALQEGLQIRELFLTRAQSASPVTAVADTPVTDDDSRADFWTTAPAIAELRQWVASFKASCFPGNRPLHDVRTLAQYLAERNIRSHWVSLTHRLPLAIQELGWVAGKAICPGAVPLTMDETKELFVIPGCPSTPHPLI
ncbi:YcaO-like family protein [Arthrobacter sp. ISL-95]|uniref:YcaO-like family protein n=1 Tax=Arthrobacter sp. ISL-95 TaxID=2819116 RepID=UPI001BE7F21C|nr:YcaO-like family protein [Arthrobacter sp. ISL-95]MBT2586668.1 YcaO-like family protein [Arthrobacter sp. ISL-95]